MFLSITQSPILTSVQVLTFSFIYSYFNFNFNFSFSFKEYKNALLSLFHDHSIGIVFIYVFKMYYSLSLDYKHPFA